MSRLALSNYLENCQCISSGSIILLRVLMFLYKAYSIFPSCKTQDKKKRHGSITTTQGVVVYCGVSKKPSVEKLWREKANMQMSWSSPSAASFGTNETQQLRKGQLVGRMMLQRLATGATGVKQARYRRRPTRGSEALVRACAVYTQR